MAEIIFTIILLIPLYGFLIWAYIEPEENMLFGERWMYREEPDFSNRSIRYTKFVSMMIMIGIPLLIIGVILKSLIYWIIPSVFVVIFILGIANILAAEEE